MEPDFYAPEVKLKSAGIRSRHLSSSIYYHWWLKQQLQKYMQEFYERHQHQSSDESIEPNLIVEATNEAA